MPGTLQQIQVKVRKLTRSPNQALLSDTELNEAINTFVLYDFPEHLRLFYFKTNLEFFTIPYVDEYYTDQPGVPGLTDFKNQYLTISAPIYIAGREVTLSQSRQQFFNVWPLNQFIFQIGAGNNITQAFAGNIGSGTALPVLQNNVSFTSLDQNLEPITVQDRPVSNTLGNLYTVSDTPTNVGTINYVTGAYNFTFPVAPGTGIPVNAQVRPYQPSIPTSILFYDTKFTLRPVPDQAYRVVMEAYIRPTALLESTDEPGLQEFWQYIAYGAAKKIFEDRMDLESVSQILPEYEKQELLCLRRTIVQRTNERTSTIYTQDRFGNGWAYNWWGYY